VKQPPVASENFT